MRLVNKDALLVVGVPVRASWNDLWTEMPKAWRQFIGRQSAIANPVGDTFLDISLEKSGDNYLQLIGRQVSQVAAVPNDMHAVEIPPQSYIYHKHVGVTSEIAATFGKMYDWAKQQGYDASSFKLDIGYTASGDEHEHELYVGLAPEVKWRKLREVPTDDLPETPTATRA